MYPKWGQVPEHVNDIRTCFSSWSFRLPSTPGPSVSTRLAQVFKCARCQAHFYVCGAKPAWQHSTAWPPQSAAGPRNPGDLGLETPDFKPRVHSEGSFRPHFIEMTEEDVHHEHHSPRFRRRVIGMTEEGAHHKHYLARGRPHFIEMTEEDVHHEHHSPRFRRRVIGMTEERAHHEHHLPRGKAPLHRNDGRRRAS